MADKAFIENAKVADAGVELKTSNQGKDYAAFTIMWSSGKRDASGQPVYGPTKWVNVKVFGWRAADVAATVQGGDRVNVFGNLEHFTWESNQGPKDDWVLFAESVAVSLPRAPQGGQQQQDGRQYQNSNQGQQQAPQGQQGYGGFGGTWQ